MKQKIVEISGADIYQRDKLILSNVHFSMAPGEFVYLVGDVGSGKSSLIQTLNAELPLQGGEINIAGYQLSDIKTKDIPFLRRKIGVVFQDFQLLPDRTVYNNLLFVLKATGWTDKEVINQRIYEVLDKVDMSDKINSMPHQLSGGEQQRIVIARALLNDPEIVLADEPTGNLDPATSFDIMQLLFHISCSGRSVIMATHNYSILEKFTSRTIKCVNGKIEEVENLSEIIYKY